MDGKINNILIPNVSKLPKHKDVNVSDRLDKLDGQEFKNLLDDKLNKISSSNIDHGIKLSIHAAKRLQERNLEMDSDEYLKLKGAIDKLRAKGGKDSLIITKNAAYIVDVGNNKVVTAIDKDNMAENVFTKIDSTLVVN